MEFGAHLPVLSLAGEPFSVARLTTYSRAASQLFRVLSANDHMVYSRPHLEAQRILVWPVRDELQQLELFMERVGHV